MFNAEFGVCVLLQSEIHYKIAYEHMVVVTKTCTANLALNFKSLTPRGMLAPDHFSSQFCRALMIFSVLSLYEFGSNNLVTFLRTSYSGRIYTRNKLSPQDGDINPVFRRILKSNEEDWGQHSPEHRIYIWTIYPTSCNHLSL